MECSKCLRSFYRLYLVHDQKPGRSHRLLAHAAFIRQLLWRKKKTHTHTNQGCCVVCCWPEALFSYLRIKPRDLSDVPMCCFHKLPAQPPEDSPLAPQPPAVDQTHRTSAHRDQWLQIRRARFTVWSSFKTLQTFLTHCWCFKTSFESWLSYMVQISLKKKKANSALDRF